MYDQPDRLVREGETEPTREEYVPVAYCPYLINKGAPGTFNNMVRCGRELKDRSTSRIAGAEKCAEHSRMAKLGIKI